MKIFFTDHAEDRMKFRGILEEWVYITVTSPDLKVDYALNPLIIFHYKKINEANHKVLRVVLKKLTSDDEYLIISCYFDRKMRNTL